MRFILTMIGTMFALDALWLVTSVRLCKPVLARWIVGIFGSAQLVGLVWLLTRRFAQTSASDFFLKFGLSILFIWHMIVLPLLLIAAVVALPVFALVLVIRILRPPQRLNRKPELSGPAVGGITRRQLVGLAVAAAPPLFNISLATIAMRQLDRFRVRRFNVPIAGLPADLHNLTIAQVSDMHVGRFTSGRVLREIVRVVNDLRPDLVLLTGDLINDALADLDQGLELVRAMHAGTGVYLIEGNHDLIENAAEFEARVRNSGIPFLLDQSAMVNIRGVPVQLLGLSWTRARQNRDVAINASVRQLLRQRQPESFPIFLAHHPHAFDAAAAAGLPLTLSGHTHGGQLMLNEAVGFGPALFRYWSGLYTRGTSRLIVSNGVGNWFPLRVRAPAELVHLTLLRG